MPPVRLPLAIVLSLAAFALAGAGTASAAGTIHFDSTPGTAAPPATLGPYTMTPFAPDPQPSDYVTSVEGPTGPIAFSPELFHAHVGEDWATWSHDYLGDVYATFGPLSATVTLPASTSAFYLYAEPNPFVVLSMTATAQDGTTSGAIPVDGFHGAQYFGFYGTGGAHIATITISSVEDFAIGEFGIGGKPKNYVALGDSYSSGEGNPPFIAGTDGAGDYCHRSLAAYAYVLGARYGAPPLFYACSGAVTSDITSTFHQTEPPQLTRPGVDATADLVTMTIGGNDAGFSSVLKACISQKLKADAINRALPRVVKWMGFSKDPNCAHSSSFVSSVFTGVDNVFWPAKLTYLQVLSAVDREKTSVIAADYPLLFPSDSDDQGCLSLSLWLTKDDMDFMNLAGLHLVGVLRRAAGEAGVNFVDVRDTFAGHEICGPDGSYLNAISIASGNAGSCTLKVLGKCIIPGIPIIGSFHPNGDGHELGYGAAFASYIDAAVERTPSGFPANPDPLPDPPFTPARTPVGVGELEAHAATAGTADCSDTYQPGQQVDVAGGGFAPGAAVTLYATSPGLGPSGEEQVGEATADTAGEIAATVRIPLGATGFVQPDAAAGIVFLDALGVGAVADHLDDVAMLGLAPHSSPCGTVEELPFAGFDPPVLNPPAVNPAEPGRAIPVKFSVAGATGTVADVLAAGYPQSAPVSCSAPGSPTSGDPAESAAASSPAQNGHFTYVWKTDTTWRGCRALVVKLVDGTYHRALFEFGP